MPELLAQVKTMVESASQESGTPIYVVSAAIEHPELLLLFEMFADEQAVRDHQMHGAAIAPLIAPLLLDHETTMARPIAGFGLSVPVGVGGHGPS
jgi:quinol monooxygenase YgiN